MSQSPLGVLLMAYGTPRTVEDVEPYYTHIRHGHPPTPELLQNLLNRYEAIGGLSPLNEITEAQARGLEERLNADGGRAVKVFLGMKHTHPFIEQAIADMKDAGIKETVALVLAPHYSSMSVGSYMKSARDAAKREGAPRLFEVQSWHLQSTFIDLLAERVKAAIASFPTGVDPMVIFSAHSLPQRILETNDPYPLQLRETTEAVARKLGLKKYMFAWQSAGRTADPWMGPDILEVLQNLKEQGEDNAVLCPAGFVSDHLEVLYDIDIEAQQLCKNIHLNLTRTESLNADDKFLKALSEIIRQHEPAQNRP
ncbi:ferrochelatase [Alicyclobacillus sp. SO9]|uniref:ferrochelatase n=1 Tax=Alicyclobacillus sp. SO9 TaxID=2665646 RepID=UPI0018E8034C|nr:ferrochelatase [Alicyclobacillus sp. SO9]QQE77433.1 ferrochelatase [Alicyclobacillus sp. SO9]